jgi:hypothetical protein
MSTRARRFNSSHIAYNRPNGRQNVPNRNKHTIQEVSVLSVNIRRSLAGKSEHQPLLELLQACDVAQFQEAGNNIPHMIGELHYIVRDENIEQHLLEVHCETNRLATFAKTKTLAQDATPRHDPLRLTHNCTWVKTALSNGKQLYIANAYIAGVGAHKEWPGRGSQMDACWRSLTDDIMTMMEKGPVVLMLDCNGHTGLLDDGSNLPRLNGDTTTPDRHGRSFLNLCYKTGLVITNGRNGDEGGSTFFSNVGAATMIDLCAVSPDILPYCRLRVLREPCLGVTDHAALLLIISGCATLTTKPQKSPKHCSPMLPP